MDAYVFFAIDGMINEVYLKFFRRTESRVFFACIMTGNCNTDKLKAEHRGDTTRITRSVSSNV